MKKLLSIILVVCLFFSLGVNAFAATTPNPMVQELADEAYQIGTQQGLEGDALQEFIQNYIKENMPHEAIEQDHQDYINSSYQEKLERYNEWLEDFYIYSYNSIVVVDDVGFVEYRNFANEQIQNITQGKPTADNEERYLLKPIYDCVTDITLDGYLLTKTFDGEYSLFSIDTRSFITTYDKKYDLSCGLVWNLLGFSSKPTYDVNDTENLRLLGQGPYMLPAKDTTTGKYGFINWHSGEVEIPFIYDGAQDFYDGVAAVKKDGKWGYIDSNNNIVLDFKYGSANGFNNGIAQVDNSLIDKKGNVIVTANNNFIKRLDSDYFMAYSEFRAVGYPEIYSLEILNSKSEVLFSKTYSCDNDFSTHDVSDFNYLGNGKLEYFFQGEKVVLDIPNKPISTTTATSTSNTNNTDKFTDVPNGVWYYDAVYKVKDLGIITGKGNGLFDPSGNMTVAEGITLAARVRANYNNENIPSVSGEWYAGALEYSLTQGILKNGDFTNFNKKITRAEMAYLFSNALPSTEYENINQITTLPDVSNNTKYQENIFKLYNSGIVSGSDKYGTFNPDSDIQRSEAAAIILRVVDKTERKILTLESTPPVENQGQNQTWTEGEVHSMPKVGDIVIKADGTKVVLKEGLGGVLGAGQGVDIWTNAVIKSGYTPITEGCMEPDISQMPFMKDSITGEMYPMDFWDKIKEATNPTGKMVGDSEGEIYNTWWQWSTELPGGAWMWLGPIAK